MIFMIALIMLVARREIRRYSSGSVYKFKEYALLMRPSAIGFIG